MSSNFHRIVENFVIQGGDIINNDGTSVFFLIKRVFLYMENISMMRISKEDMLVLVYFQWQIKVKILIAASSLSLLEHVHI